MNELMNRRLGIDAESLGASVLGGDMATGDPETLSQPGRFLRAPQAVASLDNPEAVSLLGGRAANVQPAGSAPAQAKAPMSADDRFLADLQSAFPGLSKEDLDFGQAYYRSAQKLKAMKSMQKQTRAGLTQYFAQLAKADSAKRSFASALKSFNEFKDAYTEGTDPDGKIIYNQKGMEAQRRLSQLKHRARIEADALDNHYKMLQKHGIDIERDVDPMTLKMLMAKGLSLQDDGLDDYLDDNALDQTLLP